jgi:acyl-CoA thioesterase II
MSRVDLPAAFRLDQKDDRHYEASSIGDPTVWDVVFGGQIMAQMILASDATNRGDGKEIASLHVIFARAGTMTKPLEIDVEPMHQGRTVGSDTVTIRQGERLCARALIFRQSDCPDLIRHQPDMPKVEGPDDSPENDHTQSLGSPGTEIRVVGGVDTWEPDAPTGPAEQNIWIRLPEYDGDSPALRQASLAYATDGFLIGTSMRPHPGLGQHMAHQSVDTGVLTHTLTFHEPVPAAEWMLMAHEGSYAGRGKAFGRAQIYTEDGRMIASYVQESLIRQGRTG